jgi:hypothetical protein
LNNSRRARERTKKKQEASAIKIHGEGWNFLGHSPKTKVAGPAKRTKLPPIMLD